MKKIEMELIYDDRGNHHYYVDGMHLSPLMFYCYRMIQIYSVKKEATEKINGNATHFANKIDEFTTELNNLRKKDGESLVGPFFYINDKLYVKTKKLLQFDDNLEFFDNELGHFDWFYDELVYDKELGLEEGSDYGRFARGRVLYDNKNGIYKIFSNPEIVIKPLMQKNLLEAFNINSDKVIMFLVDEHYILDDFDYNSNKIDNKE